MKMNLPHVQDVRSRFYSTLAIYKLRRLLGHTVVLIKGNPGEDEQGSAKMRLQESMTTF